MNWLFELSAACVLMALVLPFVWKLLPPKPAAIRARARPSSPAIDQDPLA